MKARMVATWVAAIGAAILPMTARAQDPCGGAAQPGFVRLTVRAQNVQSSAGEVAFTLYPDIKRRFLAAGGKLLRVRTKAEAGTTSACFWVAPGAYALAVYHDADGDRDFDRSRLGSPLEGFAFSNNPPTRFGLPAFEAARFEVGPAGRQLTVQTRYLRSESSR